MKYKVGIFISIASLVIFELIFFAVFREYDPFYSAPEKNEINLEHYKLIDPNLGYAIDTNVIPEEAIKNNFGFVVYSFKETQNPTTFAILGGSSSDSLMFNGNWPKHFHRLLKARDIPHIIYNGAVSGYSSNQELIKLLRDVVHIKNLNHIVVVNGMNDFIDYGDLTENHPMVHPYQLLQANKLSGNLVSNKFTDGPLLPNLIFGLKKIIRTTIKKDKMIQMGVPRDNYVSSYADNLIYMNKISEMKGIKFLAFLQPVAKLIQQMAPESKGLVPDDENQEFLNRSHHFLNQAKIELREQKFIRDYTNLFSDDEKVFLDSCHTNEAGSLKLAEKILSELDL